MTAAARLPETWERSSVGAVAAVILGQSPPGASYNSDRVGIPFFQGKAEFGALYPSVVKWTSEPKKVAEPQDVLVSVRAPVGPTNLAPFECCIGRGLAALHPLGGIDSRYLLYAMRATSDDLAAEATGTTFKAVTGTRLRDHEIAIAPLKEQRRIVDAIETHLSHLDAGVDALERASRNIERMRAAVLKAAVEGKLVPQDPSDELAEELSTVGPYPIPSSWRWSTIDQVGDVQGGIQKQPKRQPRTNAHPYLRVANVHRNRLDLAEVKRMELFDGELERLRLCVGDLLVVEGNGSRSQIGRSAVWRGEIEDCVHQNHIIRVRPGPGLHPEYLNLYWNSPQAVDHLTAVAASTSGLYTLSTSKVKAVAIPLPPRAEQDRIVGEVQRQLSFLDALTESVSRERARAASLQTSILSEAFSGRLVPQDPADEPASVLLDRIRSERKRAPA